MGKPWLPPKDFKSQSPITRWLAVPVQSAGGQAANRAPCGQPPAKLSPEITERILAHMALVRRLAWQIHRRAPASTDLDELIQTGVVALVEAAGTWEDRGHAFATYAHLRVRGAMVGCIRGGASLCRSAIARRQDVARVRDQLTQELGRPPHAADMAKALELTPAEWRALSDAIEPPQTDSLDAVYADHDGAFADPEEGADLLLVRAEGAALLTAAIARLPEREALILQLYFVEELSLDEIGATLGVGAARVCQLKKAALVRLRAMLSQEDLD
mgnify:CR=1 FL=1